MRKIFFAVVFAGLCCVFGVSLALNAGPVHAAPDSKTNDLLEIISSLSEEQQAALLLLLDALESDAQSETETKSAKEALAETIAAFESAQKSGEVDLAPFLANISEDFHHWGVNGKAGAVQWIESLSGSLFRSGEALIEIDIEDVEIEEDGDTAIAYPIYVNTPLGSVTLEISAVLEADGVWRMTGVDGL